MIGRRFLHYEIDEKLGEGGMGAVYKARDLRLGRDVALKFLPPRLTRGSEVRARFVVEGRAAAALNHPNVAVIHAIEESEDELFLVMEYIPGTPLRRSPGGVPLDDVLRFGKQIAHGLRAAHDKGIVHRDIKSSNIMVTPDGAVKIMDFGLARIGEGMDLTRSGTAMGTAAYMSPEQLRGEAVDSRSDIWSLGVVLYELMTGRLPFRGELEPALLYSILNDEPPPPSSVAPGIPPRLDRLVGRALAKRKESRYQRVADLLADLEAIDPAGGPDRGSAGAPAKPSRPPAIAVLPFSSLRSDPESDFLGFALADQVIGSLSYVTELLVRPSSSVRKYQGQAVDVREAGRDLQVEHVLSGVYLKQDDAIRLNVELVDVASDEMVWRESIHVRYDNAFELQDLVAEKVLHGLSVRFSSRERDRMRADVPADPLAYEYYMRAVSYPLTNEGQQLAVNMCEMSIALDPKYAPAWVELGYRLELWASEALLGRQVFERSAEAYRQALSLNADALPALTRLAFHFVNIGQPEGALPVIARVFELRPDSAEAHFMLAYVYRYTGMLDEAVREVERTLALDPNPRYRSTGFTYICSGDYEKAYDAFALDRDGTVGIAWRGMSLLYMGNRDGALEHFDRVAAMEPETYVGTRHGAIAAWLRGDHARALERIRGLEERVPYDHDPEHWFLLSTAYGLMQETAGCIRTLDRAVAAGFFNYPCFLRDPMLDVARGDPAFDRVLAAAKEKHEAFRTHALEIERRMGASSRTTRG